MRLETRDPLITLTTDGVAPEARYDHWARAVFDYLALDPLPSDEALAFEGHIVALIGERGELRSYRSSAASGRRTAKQCRADTGDEILFSYMAAGESIYEPEGDAPIVAGAGTFYCYDSARQSRLRWTANRQLTIALPRATVMEAIGGPVPPPSVMTRALNNGGLGPYLARHMRRLMREVFSMSAFQRATMLDATLELARSVLRASFDTAAATPDDATLYELACRYIEDHFHVAGLAAMEIAAALGCSRAHLYRVFAECGMTVADRMREARMHHARVLLESVRNMDIANVAWRCGYADASSFGKAFKRRYGATPQDWRLLRKGLPVES